MPTENKAIKTLGLNRDEIPVSEFRDTCKSFNKDYIAKQLNLSSYGPMHLVDHRTSSHSKYALIFSHDLIF